MSDEERQEAERHTAAEWARILTARPRPDAAPELTADEYAAAVERQVRFEAEVEQIDAEHHARLQEATDAAHAIHEASHARREAEVDAARHRRDHPEP